MTEKIKVKILRGCSGSGKTTIRKEMLRKQGYGIISRDDLRIALFGEYGKKYFMPQEDIVTNISIELLQQYIKRNMDIIIDNANLRSEHVRQYIEVIDYYNQLNNNITIEFLDLTDTPLKKLQEQNANRDTAIPASEVERQFKIACSNNTFYEDIYKKPTKLNNDQSKPNAVVFDLDGTLAQKSNKRGWYDTEGYIHDHLNEYVYDNYLLHKNAGHKIIICTAREEVTRMETWQWLKKHNVEFDDIYFRAADDRRKDATVKKEMWEKILEQYHILCIYDDRLDVVKYARKLGLNVFCVNHMYY